MSLAFRYRLRSVFIATTLLAATLGIFRVAIRAVYYGEWSEEQSAVAALRNLGVTCQKAPEAPTWIRLSAPRDEVEFTDRVVAASIIDHGTPASGREREIIVELNKFKHLRFITVAGRAQRFADDPRKQFDTKQLRESLSGIFVFRSFD